MSILAYQKPKPKNKHLFTMGFTGICKRTGKLFVGRLQLLAQDETHALSRAAEFYAKDFTNLEVYGAHIATDMVA